MLFGVTPTRFERAVARFELAVVHAAAKRGRVRVGGPRFKARLLMDEDDDGGEVLVVSLHEPEEALRRSGGTLPVRFRRTT